MATIPIIPTRPSVPMSTRTPSVFAMGLDTYKISVIDVFCSNRRKLVEAMSPHVGTIYLVGGSSETRQDSDHEPIFRQESYFLWLSGVQEPDCAVMIELPMGRTTLLIPKLPPEYATIMGHLYTRDEWKTKYQVDQVEYTTTTAEIDAILDMAHKDTVYVMHGRNSDSGNLYPIPPLPATVTPDVTTLFPILAECRVFKSLHELQLLQHVAEITSHAHVFTMKHVKPNMMEYQCEALFRFYCHYHFGSRLTGYTPICGCGPNSSILHYGHAGEPNARQIQDGDILLMDMGAEYFGYGSDITCSYPANGTFTKQQAGIYTAVLMAQQAVWNMVQPGVSWVDCHLAAEAALLTALSHLDIVRCNNKTIQELVEMRLGAVFMPHGLGHFIGIDTHDVGGYLPGHPERSLLPGLKSLRTCRILQESMVLTNEPGCYFIDWLLDDALVSPTHGPHLNEAVLQTYRGFGGVRLEDVFCVTQDGFINFSLCPRTLAEVEHCMAGGQWPPRVDEAPELGRKRLTDPTPLKMLPSFSISSLATQIKPNKISTIP